MNGPKLPPCGLYRTTAPVRGIEPGRLVYFHNHGNPGPGLYLPSGWKHNRAKFEPKGTPLASPEEVHLLEPLPPEGFYRVLETFYCCDKNCRQYTPESLVQLGYNGSGKAILFLPELVDGMLAVPERGNIIAGENLAKLRRLLVHATGRDADVTH